MLSDPQRILIEQPPPRKRLDTFLRTQLPSVSRGTIQRLIEQGDIRVDGKTVKSTYQPRLGEAIEINWPQPKASSAQPEEIPLTLLFEDANLIVLNKPPGLVVHPSAGHEEHTLVNALLHHCHGELSGIGGVARPGIVHRLDKDTSGCLIVAKNDATHVAVADQFARRSVQKTYDALVCGILTNNEGEIRAAIARHPSHRKRMAVTEGAERDAWTSYQVRQRMTGASLIEAQLHTGRTHQIRVHLQHIGFPLVGDETYGKRQNARLLEMVGYTAPRQMLHAAQLIFVHPHTQQTMRCVAAVPQDFQDALRALGGKPIPGRSAKVS